MVRKRVGEGRVGSIGRRDGRMDLERGEGGWDGRMGRKKEETGK